MKRKVLISGGILILVIIGVGGYFWYMMNQPLYQPGSVRLEIGLESSLSPPEQTGESEFWQVADDIQLYHFSSGTGRTVLVIHGGPGYPSTHPWRGLKPLETMFQFQYYNQRGCGLSTRPVDVFSSQNYSENTKLLEKRLGLSAQVADIERIRRILGEEKLIIIGHSFGGFLASLYAAEFPEHVAGLVLIAPANVLVMPQDDSDLFDTVRNHLPQDLIPEYNQFLAEYFNFKDIFKKSDSDLAGLQMKFARYYQNVNGDLTITEQTEVGGWMVWAMYFSMGQRHDYRDALTTIEVPVLVLHGENDLQSQAGSQMYADAFPDARLLVIQDADHFLFEDQAEQFSNEVQKFLQDIY